MLMTVAIGTLVLSVIGLVTAILLGRSASRLGPAESTVVDTINRLLPQTQCAQCGYPGCRPYAEAIAAGEAINKCPPGGEGTVRALADLLGRPYAPLESGTPPQLVAIIDEQACIGCTLCIQACPVDAIVGAPQLMHTVIAAECTGCELCIAPCPVDCIDLVPAHGNTSSIALDLSAPLPCIRCGECEDVCPRDLLPQELYWFRDMHGRLTELGLDRCIECRLCDRACPSDIPLTAIFRAAKAEIQDAAAARQRAEHAEARYARRNARLANETGKVRRRPSSRERQALIDNLRQKS